MRKNGLKLKAKSTSSENTRVKNATPLVYDGINFRSKLEAYCYKKLASAHIKADYEPLSFTLLEEFKFEGKRVQKMTYKPDFVGNDFIIECKGFANDALNKS